MLILTRRANQSVCLGDEIIVTVVKVRGGTVRLSVQAPPDVVISRPERLARPEDTPCIVTAPTPQPRK
jgi:carbon storage regulator